jgi:lysophospholipid acyltransferase (LPLAT)-like uncharacterized protein
MAGKTEKAVGINAKIWNCRIKIKVVVDLLMSVLGRFIEESIQNTTKDVLCSVLLQIKNSQTCVVEMWEGQEVVVIE